MHGAGVELGQALFVHGVQHAAPHAFLVEERLSCLVNDEDAIIVRLGNLLRQRLQVLLVDVFGHQVGGVADAVGLDGLVGRVQKDGLHQP